MNQEATRFSIDINGEEFKKIGYSLIDTIAELFKSISNKPVTTGEESAQIRKLMGGGALPEEGLSPEVLLSRAAELLVNHSLFNGHPKFMGYITSSPAPLGALADLLASAVNPNVGAQILSPVATEIEKQTIRWLSEFIGLSPNYGGILVSGGNMANFTGFLAGLHSKAPAGYREEGIWQDKTAMLIYCSKATHTWIDKAATLFGLGSKAVRWIDADDKNRIRTDLLKSTIDEDIARGNRPIMVVGTAGDVSTGAVDDFQALAAICRQYDLWFHIDGAYGIPAAVLPELKTMFAGIEAADSLALDPHKWLFSPLEAGCTLVKDRNTLTAAFSTHPVYYNFSHGDHDPVHNFYEYGLQNSRGFRALKVWLMLQHTGRTGYEKMIRKNIELSRLMFDLAAEHPELQAETQSLSIATFRFVPHELVSANHDMQDYLNKLNETLLNKLQAGGELFLSNAVIAGKYCLRACIVNFRTTETDVREMMEIIAREGRKVHLELSPAEMPLT